LIYENTDNASRLTNQLIFLIKENQKIKNQLDKQKEDNNKNNMHYNEVIKKFKLEQVRKTILIIFSNSAKF